MLYGRDFGAGAIAASKISREKSERVLPAFAAALSSLSASPQGRLSGKLTRRSPSIRGRPIRFAVHVVILFYLLCFIFSGRHKNRFFKPCQHFFLKINKNFFGAQKKGSCEPLWTFGFFKFLRKTSAGADAFYCLFKKRRRIHGLDRRVLRNNQSSVCDKLFPRGYIRRSSCCYYISLVIAA